MWPTIDEHSTRKEFTYVTQKRGQNFKRLVAGSFFLLKENLIEVNI